MQSSIYDGEERTQAFSYENLVDSEELQRLQNFFCKATGVCAYCVDAIGGEQRQFQEMQKTKRLCRGL